MRIVTESECEAWIGRQSQGAFSWASLERRYSHVATYLTPVDTGRKTALARMLSSVANGSGESLLWIRQWGVFPSSENMALFEAYRRSLSEHRALAVAPGHVFQNSDLEAMECVLALVLYFFWDASLFAGADVWLRFSHDEVFSIHARDKAVLTEWQEVVAPFELETV